MTLVRFFINQRLFINLLSIVLIGLGYFSLSTLNRELFPAVEMDLVIISAIYPGASPAEMESLVTVLIEDKLKEADGIKELDSYSIDDRIGVVVTLDPDLPERRAVIDDIRRLVDGIREFPSDMDRPIITEITSRKRPIGSVVVTATGTTTDYKSLRERARFVEDGLKELTGVAEVSRSGYRNREFRVEIIPGKLTAYNIGVGQIYAAIAARNTNIPIGSITRNGQELTLKTPGKVSSIEELGNIVIRANEEGHVVLLKHVANIHDDFEEPLTLTRVNGAPAVILTVYKNYRFDTITTINLVKDHLKEVDDSPGFRGAYDLRIINNAARRVETRIQVLSSNAYIGIILVLLTLFLFLNWRMALITGFGIPLAFGITFALMKFLNYNLDLLTLLGLIVVVGMIVDDAIIVAENIYRHMELGKTPIEAAVHGTGEVIMPVAATIMTSIAAFTPLLIMSGTRGKFAFFIAVVVILALMASWLESMLALPSHVVDFMKPNNKEPARLRKKLDGVFTSWRESYGRALEFCLHWKSFFIGAMATLTGLAAFLMVSGILPFVPFPRDGIERFILACRAPQGTELHETEKRINRVEKFLVKSVPGVKDPANPGPREELLSFRTEVGVIQSRPGSRWSEYGSHFAVIFADLTGHTRRERSGTQIIKDLNKKLATGVDPKFIDCKIKKSLFGAATKGAIELNVAGENPLVLEQIRKEIYKTIDRPGKNYVIDDSSQTEKSVMSIHVPQATLAIMGLNNEILNTTLRTAFEGSTPSSLRLDGEEVKIKLIFPEHFRKRLDSLNHIYLTNQRGALVPLSNITRTSESKSLARIAHKNWKQTLTVTLDPAHKNTSAREIVNSIRSYIKPLQEKYPGYKIEFAGSYKEETETRSELLNSFYIALLFIFLILITLFKSIFQPIIVMTAIPLGFIGAVIATMAHGHPMSFMGGIGFIGLIGVVVNDSLVMVEFINKSVQGTWDKLRSSLESIQGPADFRELQKKWRIESMPLVVAGAKIRFRPVLLTTITTFFGLLPTAYGIGGDDPYIKPLAIVFAWGLIFATVNTLITIPAIYLAYLPARLWMNYQVLRVKRFFKR